MALVTPSLNQARFVEQALGSVLDQSYPRLEYVIADGGSTDGTVELIERHADRLSSWWSEPDGGPAAAVARGFAATSGEIMGWLNADDALLPRSLWLVAHLFETFPHVDWITTGFPLFMDEDGRVVHGGRALGFAREPFLAGLHGGLTASSPLYYPQQESTFWRRRLWDAAGARLEPSAEPAADFELWSRFFALAELYTVDAPLAAFRAHPAQRTSTQLDGYREQARAVLGRATPPRLLRTRATVARLAPARLPLGFSAPFLRWSRTTRRFEEGRRRYA